MTPTRLHHVHFTVPSDAVDQARAFYCGVLGLEEMEKPESLKPRGGLWLLLNEVQIHIGVQDGVERQPLKAHLAFQVEDLEAWQTKLTDYGLTLLDSIPIPGYARFETRDPFGNRLEFIQPLMPPPV